MEYETIKLEKQDSIAVLTLNRPEKLNAVNEKMGTVELPDVLEKIKEDDTTRVIVITGAGKGFCTGADVGEVTTMIQSGLDLAGGASVISKGLYNLEKPVIAAVNGVAAGAGFSIALLADIRIASEFAKFGMSFVHRGAIPDCGATFTIPRLVGAARSFEMMYTGNIIDAKEAERIGLVNKVVPHDSLMVEAMAMAMVLSKAAPLALAQIKRAVHNGILNDFEQQLSFESDAQNFCFGTEDFKEGVSSFLEKREPNFQGT